MLATKNSYGVAWLLVQHKTYLDHKVLKSVTIFWPDDNGEPPLFTSYPSLLWEVADYGQGVVNLKNQYEGKWSQALGPTMGYPDPCAYNRIA